MSLESLPPEIIAACLEELPLKSLIVVSYLSRHLYNIASDYSLNPWRKPILRILRSVPCDEAAWLPLSHLAVRHVPPRSNFIDILSLATPDVLLFQTTLPNLPSEDWREAFHRRFLPSCDRWHQDNANWRHTFLKILYRVWHRTHSLCTADEAWTKYLVLNKNGSVNLLEMGSRNFNPITIFNELKLQSNVMHLETRVRLLIQFADVRILVFGTLNRPRSDLASNHNAHLLLHPPGIDVPSLRHHAPRSGSDNEEIASICHPAADHGIYPGQALHNSPIQDRFPSYASDYTKLTHPLPAISHGNYPFYTPSGLDARWNNPEDNEETGLRWVGSMLMVAQLIMPNSISSSHGEDLISDPGRSQWCSLSWSDLWVIAPWMQERVPTTMRVDGPGLGEE